MIGNERPVWVRKLDELHLLTPLRIVAIVVVAVVLTMLVRRLVNRLLRRTFGLSAGDRSRAEARQRALATTLRSSLVGTVWAVAVISIVSEVGFNIGGFIATATVIGGAIAFGAQTLIRDVIAGFFVLAEDQYGVGDQVDVGHASGVVDRISLRSVRLLDGEGRVWHVAHGAVVRVANLSKSSTALLDIEVARSTRLVDLDRVAAELAAELKADVSVATSLAGSPVVTGVIGVGDDRLTYRVSVPTAPGRHDDVRRAWRLLALRAFERGDLVAPPAPTTIVRIVGGAAGDD